MYVEAPIDSETLVQYELAASPHVAARVSRKVRTQCSGEMCRPSL
jgi:hypothetical protein